ncbi:MAG: response regulator [Anaerolineae bacterium]|nr:response regulator [Anaerolineae bacterium]
MTYVLVVEDDPHVQFLIQRRLETADYKVRTTNNGEDALRLAQESLPRVVILDIMLPGKLTGLDVCRELKERLKPNAPPIILVSALGQLEDVSAGEDAGADDYMIKPFSPRELLQHVEDVLKR